MEKDIKILLVDDHQVVLEGLRSMLELEPDFTVVGEVSNANEALKQVELLSPEVILMDIKMPGVDGIELTRQIKQKQLSCNVIMFTMYGEYLTNAIESGANGYLLKDIKREELVRAIRFVRQGRLPIYLSISQDNRDELITSVEGKQRVSLSERELTILSMIAKGVTTRDVASQLLLSQASVKRSVRLIFEKLDVRNRSEAVAEAYKRSII